MKLFLIALLAGLLLSGCVAVTPAGVVFTLKPIVDYRIPAPEVVEALEDIEAETGVACINLNTADAESLQLIVHIGPYRAEYIEDLRELFEFDGPDALRVVPGIGERRLADIREQNLVCGTD